MTKENGGPLLQPQAVTKAHAGAQMAQAPEAQADFQGSEERAWIDAQIAKRDAKPQAVLIRKKEAARRVGYHPVHIMSLAKAGKFPAPVYLSDAAVCFIESEVQEWIDAKIAKRDAKLARGAPPVAEAAA